MKSKRLLSMALAVCGTTAFVISSCSPTSKTIAIKAAVVYKTGRAEPVARTKFYLLKEDLLSVTKKSIGLLGLQANYESQVKQAESGGKHALSLGKEVETAAISTVTTDFEGNGEFAPVPSGVYYITGVTETRSGVAIWNVKVDLQESTTIILDQTNTAYMD